MNKDALVRIVASVVAVVFAAIIVWLVLTMPGCTTIYVTGRDADIEHKPDLDLKKMQRAIIIPQGQQDEEDKGKEKP